MARFRHVDQPEEPVVSVPPWPNYLLTLDEWAALPEDNMYYCELVEGTIQVCPRPTSDHQLAHAELRYQLRQQLADEFRCVPEVEVVATAFPQATVRTPDLVVVPRKIADTGPSRYQAADVLLAVEVAADGSWERDHVTKLYEYEAAGIPDYWILDLDDPMTLSAYRLIDGDYELIDRSERLIELTEPAPVTIDVAALLPHRS